MLLAVSDHENTSFRCLAGESPRRSAAEGCADSRKRAVSPIGSGVSALRREQISILVSNEDVDDFSSRFAASDSVSRSTENNSVFRLACAASDPLHTLRLSRPKRHRHNNRLTKSQFVRVKFLDGPGPRDSPRRVCSQSVPTISHFEAKRHPPARTRQNSVHPGGRTPVVNLK